MKIWSALAIYLLFWWGCLFLVLPFRLRVDERTDAHIPGQMEGAPHRFSVKRTVLWTTIVSATAFALFYANYINGWVGVEAFDITHWRER